MWGPDKAFKGNKNFAAPQRNCGTEKRKKWSKDKDPRSMQDMSLKGRTEPLQEPICHFSDKLLLIERKCATSSMQSRSSDIKLFTEVK